ncbi:hypothetical protein [Emticicia sp. C21]|uniref:hypothetical protein n=1 Tax=Emticicia sp. C21 TaxID=2302915 RepID=UPI000E354CF5|nr:hypothetical protein [Emticicia sp. C21]RFS18058.1 hypothetical protein D0T08_02080 [Emticicia sp. C21]
MVGTFLNKDCTGSLFKRAIGYTYQRVFSELVKVPATYVALKKVTNMVGTFLNVVCTGDLYKRATGYNYQQEVSEFVRVSATQTESKKVTYMVGTFLIKDIYC